MHWTQDPRLLTASRARLTIRTAAGEEVFTVDREDGGFPVPAAGTLLRVDPAEERRGRAGEWCRLDQREHWFRLDAEDPTTAVVEVFCSAADGSWIVMVTDRDGDVVVGRSPYEGDARRLADRALQVRGWELTPGDMDP